MAEKSNADLDLSKLSRDGKNSTYKSVKPEAEDAGPQVEQILGEPKPKGKTTEKKAGS